MLLELIEAEGGKRGEVGRDYRQEKYLSVKPWEALSYVSVISSTYLSGRSNLQTTFTGSMRLQSSLTFLIV